MSILALFIKGRESLFRGSSCQGPDGSLTEEDQEEEALAKLNRVIERIEKIG
jgi:hypothetical protein